MGAKNLFQVDAGPEWSGELVDDLLIRPGVRIERIVSRGDASPDGFWYDQEEAEWVVVLTGAAVVSLEDPQEDRRLGPGDHLFIPAHRRHRVAWTAPGEDTIWLAVFWSPGAINSDPPPPDR